LELGVQIGRQFGIKLSGNSAENKEYFYSVQTLTIFVESQLLKGNA
jgi:acyl carrier protein